MENVSSIRRHDLLDDGFFFPVKKFESIVDMTCKIRLRFQLEFKIDSNSTQLEIDLKTSKKEKKLVTYPQMPYDFWKRAIGQ